MSGLAQANRNAPRSGLAPRASVARGASVASIPLVTPRPAILVMGVTCRSRATRTLTGNQSIFDVDTRDVFALVPQRRVAHFAPRRRSVSLSLPPLTARVTTVEALTAPVNSPLHGRVAEVAIEGSVQTISGVVDPERQSEPTRVLVDNAKGILRPNSFVELELKPKHGGGALLVPTSAVVTDGPDTAVFVKLGVNHYKK